MACWRHHAHRVCADATSVSNIGGDSATRCLKPCRHPIHALSPPPSLKSLPGSSCCRRSHPVLRRSSQPVHAGALAANPVRQTLCQNSGSSQPPQSLEQGTGTSRQVAHLLRTTRNFSLSNKARRPEHPTCAQHCSTLTLHASKQHASELHPSERAAGRGRPCTHCPGVLQTDLAPKRPVHAYLQTARTSSNTPASTATINNLCGPHWG